MCFWQKKDVGIYIFGAATAATSCLVWKRTTTGYAYFVLVMVGLSCLFFHLICIIWFFLKLFLKYKFFSETVYFLLGFLCEVRTHLLLTHFCSLCNFSSSCIWTTWTILGTRYELIYVFFWDKYIINDILCCRIIFWYIIHLQSIFVPWLKCISTFYTGFLTT